MSNVLVVGAGNFGCWWAAGLLKEIKIDSVTLYDPHQNNSELVKYRALELGPPSREFLNDRLFYAKGIEQLCSFYDLVVISTSSRPRLRVFKQLMSTVDANYWVLEKVLTSCPVELQSFHELSNNKNVYVSHSRRLQPLWQNAALILENAPRIDYINQTLGPWDLASNIFHFADIVGWLFRAALVSAKVTNGSWNHSEKRNPGYFDLNGNIELVYDNGLIHRVERRQHISSNLFQFGSLDASGSRVNQLIIEEPTGIIKNIRFGQQTIVPLYDWSKLITIFTRYLVLDDCVILPPLSSVYDNTMILLAALREHWKNEFGCLDNFSIS